MNKIICWLFILFVIFIQANHTRTQDRTDFNNLVPGKTYKIVLFDDTEFFGKVISADSGSLNIETDNKTTVTIPKNNILYYSTDLTPSKYNWSFSLLGGVSLFTENNDYSYYYSTAKTGPNLNLAMIVYLSDSKALKIDAGYTHVKAQYSNANYNTDPHYQSIYNGGNASLYSFKFGIMFGRFIPKEKFMLDVSLGFGFHYSSREEVTELHWTKNYPDTNWVQRTYITPSSTEFNALISIGGDLGFRFTKNFGAKAELEYNFVTGDNTFLFLLGGRSYFPVRAGIFYIFY